MFEKVNPMHPDKVADRIAGAIVDMAYAKEENPKVAVEVLIGHKTCFIITESSVVFDEGAVVDTVCRISGEDNFDRFELIQNPQDPELAKNQSKEIRIGDNGIFKGVVTTSEEQWMSDIAHAIYEKYPSDGKYILDIDNNKLIICQSNADDVSVTGTENLTKIVNPLGYWTGGINVDTGATNRKLGSDMGHGVTGGGLHGKDLSKADVSINIYAYLKAQELGHDVSFSTAIGDDSVDGKPYSEIVEIARNYIKSKGGFEKFAEWGLI